MLYTLLRYSIRLRGVIHKVVAKSQSVFVGGRHMLDGVFIANEIIHEEKSKKKPTLIFMVDFEMTYDIVIVNWDFLFSMMVKMGFSNVWLRGIRDALNHHQFLCW
ncbi:hypothetical protein AAZV13_01G042800 [Glycine max]